MKKPTLEERLKLEVQLRKLVGKKVKKLRKQGLIPANIFGPEFKSKAISINLKDLLKIYKIAKETAVIYLKLDKEEIPVLIKNIQRHPINDFILHVDFRKIDLNKKIKTAVPIKIIGQSEAVTQKGGILLLQTELINIEALPENIPQQIEVDISVIKDIGQEIKISDLKKSDKYEIKTEADKVVASVVEHKEESITPDTTATAPEVITEAPKEEAPSNTTTETKEEVKPETPSPKK